MEGYYIGCCVFSLSGYRYLCDGGNDWCEISTMAHISSGQKVPFGGSTPRASPKSQILGLNFVHLTANISKTVSDSVTCQLELNISSISGSLSVSWA